MEFKIGQIILDKENVKGLAKHLENPSWLNTHEKWSPIQKARQKFVISGDDAVKLFYSWDMHFGETPTHNEMARKLELERVYGGADIWIESPENLLITGHSGTYGTPDYDLLEANKQKIIDAYAEIVPSVRALRMIKMER